MKLKKKALTVLKLYLSLKINFLVISLLNFSFQGTAGLSNALIIVALCTLFSAITVLSAIGICERTKIQHGGIYFLVSHVLGKQIGGSIGIIYTVSKENRTFLL